jgi:hypothetical protein
MSKRYRKIAAICLMKLAMAMGHAQAEQNLLTSVCFNLVPYSDVMIVDVFDSSSPINDDSWDFILQSRLEGRLSNNTLLYDLQGTGASRETPDSMSTIIDINYVNPTNSFAKDPFVHILASVNKKTIAGTWAINTTGVMQTYHGNGVLMPVKCSTSSEHSSEHSSEIALMSTSSPFGPFGD